MLAILLASGTGMSAALEISPDTLVAPIEYQNSFLYFFSSLAQSAAALMAIAAVFATFRLQHNAEFLNNLLYEAVSWLVPRGHMHSDDPKDIDFVMGKLELLKTKPDAAKLINKLNFAKDFPGKLNLLLSKPLKLWAIVFFVSLISLPLFQIEQIRLRITVIGSIAALSILTAWALWETKKFIQKCLETK